MLDLRFWRAAEGDFKIEALKAAATELRTAVRLIGDQLRNERVPWGHLRFSRVPYEPAVDCNGSYMKYAGVKRVPYKRMSFADTLSVRKLI